MIPPKQPNNKGIIMSQSCCSKKPAETIAKLTLLGKIKLYRPLIIMADVSLLSAWAVSFNSNIPFMNALMGFFLLFLSSLKLFNITGFANTFKTYDVIARRITAYGLAYPFIELGLSLLYFSGLFPLVTNSIMLVVMLTGCIGVLQVIGSKSKVQCACVGTVFNLPVGKVTLAENFIMGAMAGIGIFESLINFSILNT